MPFQKGNNLGNRSGRKAGSLSPKNKERLKMFQEYIEEHDLLYASLKEYARRLKSGELTDAGLVNGFKAMIAPYMLKTLADIDLNDNVEKALSAGQAEQQLLDIANKLADIKKIKD